ncbi:TPA: lipopolysaccharide biosynthesis protein, partial [Vibrio cholerae]
HFDLDVFAYLLMFFIANIIYTSVLQLVVKNIFVNCQSQYNDMLENNESSNVKDKSFKNKMLLLVIMSSLCFQSDKLILAKFVSSEILGYYSLAFTIASFPMIFTSAFYYYLFPKLVVLKSSNQTQRYEAEITKNSLVMMIGVTSICIYAAAYSKYVLLLFFGDEVLAKEVSEILKYLILGSLIQGILMIPYCAQLAFGRISYLVNVNVFLGVMMIAAQIYAASYLTPIDVAKCWLAYNVVTLVVIFFNLKNITGIENKFKWIAIGTFLPILICVFTLFVTHFLLNVLTNINELLIIVPSGIVSLLLIAAYAFYMMRHIDGK